MVIMVEPSCCGAVPVTWNWAQPEVVATYPGEPGVLACGVVNAAGTSRLIVPVTA